MGYTIDFEPHRFDGTTYEGIDSFSREPATCLTNNPLTPEEVEAVHAVLRRASGGGPDERGTYHVTLEDGLSVRFFAGALPRGCVLAIDGFTAPLSLAKLVFDLLVAGGWVLRGVATSGESIAHTLDSVRGTRGTFGPTVVVESAEDLQFILAHGLVAWQQEQRGFGGQPRWK